MPFYHKLGEIPPKRHTQFKKPDGSFTTSNYLVLLVLMACLPTVTTSNDQHRSKKLKGQYSVAPKIAKANNMQSYRLHGFKVKPENDYLESRKIVLTNSDCNIILAAPQHSTKDYFYKNTDADELIFIHKGTGKLTYTS